MTSPQRQSVLLHQIERYVGSFVFQQLVYHLGDSASWPFPCRLPRGLDRPVLLSKRPHDQEMTPTMSGKLHSLAHSCYNIPVSTDLLFSLYKLTDVALTHMCRMLLVFHFGLSKICSHTFCIKKLKDWRVIMQLVKGPCTSHIARIICRLHADLL